MVWRWPAVAGPAAAAGPRKTALPPAAARRAVSARWGGHETQPRATWPEELGCGARGGAPAIVSAAGGAPGRAPACETSPTPRQPRRQGPLHLNWRSQSGSGHPGRACGFSAETDFRAAHLLAQRAFSEVSCRSSFWLFGGRSKILPQIWPLTRKVRTGKWLRKPPICNRFCAREPLRSVKSLGHASERLILSPKL